MAYVSDIRLEIGEVPKTDDPKYLADFIDVYNSVHILAQHVDSLVKSINEQNDPEGKTPAELRPPKKSLDGQIGADCIAGNLLTMFDLGDGELYWMPGGPVKGIVEANRRSIIGIALEDGSAYDTIPIAIGPAVMELTGAVHSKFYYLDAAMVAGNPRPNAGYLQVAPTLDGISAPVAQGIAENYVMIFDSVVWFETAPLTPDQANFVGNI